MQTEDALQKLMDALLLKVKKTRELVKELKTQYIEGNVDVARPVVLYNCMSTASTLKTSLSTIIPAQGHQNTGVRHQDP